MKRLAFVAALACALPAFAQLSTGAGLKTGSFSASLLAPGATGSDLTLSGALVAATVAANGAGTSTFASLTFQLSNNLAGIFFSGSGPQTIESNSTDAVTSSTVPAMWFKCDVDIANTDLCIGLKNSANALQWGITEAGVENAIGGFQLNSEAVDLATAITVTACSGGTAATVTAVNGTAAVQFDVGTSCASESTAVLTFPALAAGWTCSCSSTTADKMLVQRVMPSASTTTVTMQNITISTGANGDFADSADVACLCRGLGL